MNNKNLIRDWTELLLAKGRFCFSVEELKDFFPEQSSESLKAALLRLRLKDKILPVFRGFYLIIPPQYANMGVLPPHMFIDQLMKHLNRLYYISLLSAATYYGAAHQSPQEFFVMTGFPVLRETRVAGLKINYISVRELPSKFILKIKTDAGYASISSSALTMLDVIRYQHRIGGLNRSATVINEMLDTFNTGELTDELLGTAKISVVQRLGFIFDLLDRQDASNKIYEFLKESSPKFEKNLLNPSKPATGFQFNRKWNIVVNTQIEVDV